MSKDPYDWTADKEYRSGLYKGTHRAEKDPTTRKLLVVWEVRWNEYPDGVRKQCSRLFRREDGGRDMAVAFMLERRNERQAARHGVKLPPPNRTDTFEQRASNYIRRRTNPRTVRLYTGSLRRMKDTCPTFTSMRVGLIRNSDVELMQADMQRAGFSGHTILNAIWLTFAVLRDAAKEEHIRPLAFGPPKQDVNPPKPTPDQDELVAILQALPPQYMAMIGAMAVIGLRNGETRGLALDQIDGLHFDMATGQWSYDPDPAKWVVRVHYQLIDRGGLEPVKGSNYRTVYPEEAAMVLLVMHLNRWGPGPATPHGKLMFRRWDRRRARAQGGVPLDRGLWSNDLDNIIERASVKALGRKFNAHSFRRFYVTERLDSGAVVRTVADEVGHSDTRITERIYHDVSRRRAERGSTFRAIAAAASAHDAAALLPPMAPITPLTRGNKRKSG